MRSALSARRFGVLTAVTALFASLMAWAPARPADASLGFDNARMADIALSYVGQPGVNACLAAGQGTAYAGQCKQFVNCIIVLSGGPMPGGGNDYAGSFIAAGGTEISEGAATKGDIIQWGSGSTTSQHTAIVVANLGGGRFDVVDSNWGTPGLMVKHHTIANIHADIFNGAGAQPTRFIRMGTVNGGGVAEGAFVSYNGDVFRIAGGAPVYVSNWDHVGGNPGNVRALTAGEFAALRQRPADGTLISGWAPGDPDHGSVYRVAGGAPVYVSSWSHIGGDPGTTVGVDLFAIKHAGGGGVLDHLRQRPADGTLISGWAPGDPDHGSVYRVAGGAPVYVSSWSHIGGDPGTTVGVDLFAIKHAGGGGVLDHLRQRPADGTLISGWTPGDPDHGSVYRVAGGAPVYVSSWSHIGGDPGTTVGVDLFAIKHAGGGGVLDHLRQRPADGTMISGWTRGDPDHGSVYRVAGGAPIYVLSWSHIGGDPGTTVGVDLAAIRKAGSAGVWNHLLYRPSDGTYLKAANKTYRVAQGAPILQSAAHDGVVVDHVAIANAGKPGVWSHLAAPPSQTPVVQPGNPPAVQPAAQTVRVKRKTVKKGRSVRLPASTSQGAPLTWSAWPKRVCSVTGRRLKAKRKGRCRIGGLAPAVPGFSAFATTRVVRVR